MPSDYWAKFLVENTNDGNEPSAPPSTNTTPMKVHTPITRQQQQHHYQNTPPPTTYPAPSHTFFSPI